MVFSKLSSCRILGDWASQSERMILISSESSPESRFGPQRSSSDWTWPSADATALLWLCFAGACWLVSRGFGPCWSLVQSICSVTAEGWTVSAFLREACFGTGRDWVECSECFGLAMVLFRYVWEESYGWMLAAETLIYQLLTFLSFPEARSSGKLFSSLWNPRSSPCWEGASETQSSVSLAEREIRDCGLWKSPRMILTASWFLWATWSCNAPRDPRPGCQARRHSLHFDPCCLGFGLRLHHTGCLHQLSSLIVYCRILLTSWNFDLFQPCGLGCSQAWDLYLSKFSAKHFH